MLRGERVDMVVFMRSNDAYLGLPHDIFAFTMLQELVARTIGAELGTYVHMVGSLHLYDNDRDATNEFLEEGFASFRPMPPMPPGDPTAAVEWIVEAEAAVRVGGIVEPDSVGEPYWADLVRLLNIYALSRLDGNTENGIAAIRQSMHCDVYDVFLNDKFGVLGA